MTKQARWSYVVLAITLILIGLLQLGVPFLALLFSYLVLTKLGRYIPNKWVTLAIFIMIWVAIGFVAGHFVRAAINALPTIADKSVPSAIAWAEEHNFNLPFEDFEGLKATAMTTLKDQAKYLGDFANFARHASTTFVFIIIAIVCAVSIFFNSRLDLFRESHKVRNNLYSVCTDEITARFSEFYHSFATVIGAQMTISAINTVQTAIFVFSTGCPTDRWAMVSPLPSGFFPFSATLLANPSSVSFAFSA